MSPLGIEENPNLMNMMTGEAALHERDQTGRTTMEHDRTIVSGEVASNIHVLPTYRPHVNVKWVAQELKHISSRVLPQKSGLSGMRVGSVVCGPEEMRQ